MTVKWLFNYQGNNWCRQTYGWGKRDKKYSWRQTHLSLSSGLSFFGDRRVFRGERLNTIFFSLRDRRVAPLGLTGSCSEPPFITTFMFLLSLWSASQQRLTPQWQVWVRPFFWHLSSEEEASWSADSSPSWTQLFSPMPPTVAILYTLRMTSRVWVHGNSLVKIGEALGRSRVSEGVDGPVPWSYTNLCEIESPIFVSGKTLIIFDHSNWSWAATKPPQWQLIFALCEFHVTSHTALLLLQCPKMHCRHLWSQSESSGHSQH